MSQHPLNLRPASMIIDGEEWVPKTYADTLADKLREQQRSRASHNQQFAEINDLWANLLHHQASAPYAKSADAFRKHGLIATGHCDTDTIVFESKAAACAAAPVIANLARKAHGYALVIVRKNFVICSTPHSQSYKAMGKERFQASKQAVLDWGHSILGVAA